MRNTLVALLAISSLGLTGCADKSPETAKDVAQVFWQSVQTQDVVLAERYSTANASQIKELMSSESEAKMSFKRAENQPSDNPCHTYIETRVDPKDVKEDHKPLIFNTVVSSCVASKSEDAAKYVVDYDLTNENMFEEAFKLMSEMLGKAMRESTENVSEHLEKSLDAISEAEKELN